MADVLTISESDPRTTKGKAAWVCQRAVVGEVSDAYPATAHHPNQAGSEIEVTQCPGGYCR